MKWWLRPEHCGKYQCNEMVVAPGGGGMRCKRLAVWDGLCQKHQPPPPQLFVIWCKANGNEHTSPPLWWRPERAGYTSDLDEAGRYSAAEAREIERMGRKDTGVPLRVAFACVRAYVDLDRLREAVEDRA